MLFPTGWIFISLRYKEHLGIKNCGLYNIGTYLWSWIYFIDEIH